MNNLKRLKWAVAILAVLMVALVTGCTDNHSAEASNTEDKLLDAKISEQLRDEAQPENEVQIETFTSKEGGFSLKQPEKWNNHVGVVEHKGDPATGVEWESSFYLLVDGKPDIGNGSIMNITKLSKEQYDKMMMEEGPSADDILGKNEDYVWIMNTPQSNPYDDKSEQYKRFNTMLVNAEFIRMHFKLNS